MEWEIVVSRFLAPVADFQKALVNWASTILFLMAQELGFRFRTSRIGVVFIFIEPVVLIVALLLMRVYFRGRLPDFGTSTAVFYSSGVLPYYVFLRISLRTRGTRYDAAQRLPGINSTDLALASALAEAALILSIMIVWFAGMYFYGLDEARPASAMDCLIPLLLFIALGMGIGLLNSAITRRFALWNFVYGRLTYGLMFMSGAFYVVDLLPLSIRDVIVWNPLLHGIEWFRLGLYGQYPVHTLDTDYLLMSAGVILLVGVVSHRATLRTLKW